MKTNTRSYLQKLVIETSFPPFTYFYKFMYQFSIFFGVWILKRLKGIRAIYLRRGVAKDEIIYGLSDIDIMLIVQDFYQERKNIFISVYNKLSSFFPLFGKAEDELEIYTPEEFFKLFDDYNFYKYRFYEGKKTWRLLFGRDYLKDIPELHPVELRISAVEELKVWWKYLSRVFLENPDHPVFIKKYLMYKVISETCKIYLFVCQNEDLLEKRQALSRVQKYLSLKEKGYIQTVKSYIMNLNSPEDFEVDNGLKLFIKLSQKVLQTLQDYNGKRLKIRSDLHKARIHLKKKLDNGVKDIWIEPQVYFGADVLNNDHIDSFNIIALLKEMPTFKRLREIYSANQGLISSAAEIFVVYEDIALSLSNKRIEGNIKIFSHERKTFHWTYNLSESLLKRNRRLDDVISQKKIYKLKAQEFYRFFWAAIQTKIVIREMRKNNDIYIPITTEQILNEARKHFPDRSGWFQNLYDEYHREEKGMESQAHHFYMDSFDFLKSI